MEILNLRMRVEALERAMGIVSAPISEPKTPPALKEAEVKKEDKKASKSE